MIPLRDSMPSGSVPVVTILLIVLNGIMWLYELSLGPKAEAFVSQYGLTPVKFVAYNRFDGGFAANALTPLFTSIFMHGSWLHIIGNMWFLWIFGDNVEDRLGHLKYLVFYLLCGIGASLAHVAFHPTSTMPVIGASGAISGVLGAYLLSYPGARIHTLLIIFVIIRFVEIPAFAFILFWFVFQFLSGALELSAHQDTAGVAYWAHMGGFVAGILLLLIMPKNPGYRTVTWEDTSGRRFFTRW
jgi:membrane associated rhomboid family serine protease